MPFGILLVLSKGFFGVSYDAVTFAIAVNSLGIHLFVFEMRVTSA